jgi:hypothetical protein
MQAGSQRDTLSTVVLEWSSSREIVVEGTLIDGENLCGHIGPQQILLSPGVPFVTCSEFSRFHGVIGSVHGPALNQRPQLSTVRHQL